MSSSAQQSAGMPSVEISWGELIDRITILEIKQQRLTSPEAVANVLSELAALCRVVQALKPAPSALGALKQKLRTIN